jgi:hypothetical protein
MFEVEIASRNSLVSALVLAFKPLDQLVTGGYQREAHLEWRLSWLSPWMW